VLVAAAPSTVTWLTGFFDDLVWGPAPFQTGPLAVVSGDERTLIVSTDQEADAAATGCRVVTYPGFSLDDPDPAGRQVQALRGLALSGRVASEPGVLSAAAAAVLGEPVVDARPALLRLQAVKSPDEVERIRGAVRLADAGIAACRAAADAGVREIDVWAETVGAIERAAGGRVPVLADLVSGPRTEGIGGPPGERALEDGDVILCDLSPRLRGWWADSCVTIAVGEPPPELARAHERAVETLDALIEAIEPGLAASALDALGRSRMDYPHHTGHGIGVTPHQFPRIVPDSTWTLEPGMVIALEPGTYPGPWGVRVERVAVVSEGGCEVLSGHSLDL
jgi:Xaa-Pro dipeptidase